MKPFVRSPYNYDTNQASKESATDVSGESRTNQAFKDECDINYIVKRFGVTGVLPAGHRLPEYGDFEGISDFRTAMEAIRSAQENFMELPSSVRAKFRNDPQEFLEFCSHEENLPELRKMGLAKEPKKEYPLPVGPITGEESAKGTTQKASESSGASKAKSTEG